MTKRKFYEKNPEFGFCRGLANHLFKVKQISERNGLTTVHLFCTTCKCSRHDSIDMEDGTIHHRSYSYKPGYILKPDKPGYRIPKADIRLEYVRFALPLFRKGR